MTNTLQLTKRGEVGAKNGKENGYETHNECNTCSRDDNPTATLKFLNGIEECMVTSCSYECKGVLCRVNVYSRENVSEENVHNSLQGLGECIVLHTLGIGAGCQHTLLSVVNICGIASLCTSSG